MPTAPVSSTIHGTLIRRGTTSSIPGTCRRRASTPILAGSPHLEAATRVVSVEGNATAQFTRLLRRETGFDITTRVLRYDGLPITPEYVLRSLESAGVLS